MFTQNPDESIRTLGEVALIAQIREWLGAVAPKSPRGMGDDCAVVNLPNNQQQILTTDSLSYGQHFNEKVSAKDAGAKLIKRNLSDIAAMGGYPGEALLTLLCGGDLQTDWLKAFFEGIRETCLQHNLPIVGGDISTLPDGQFISTLTLTGYLKNPALLRSGAQAGDAIYATGALGGSILKKQYQFEPRLAEGQWLAQSEACSALMDVTDGLAKDLRELIPAGCAALIDLGKIPLSADVLQIAEASGKTALEHAFCDGEDYELLFTVKKETDLDTFEAQWQQRLPETTLTRIGQMELDASGAPYICAQSKETLPWVKGFEHLIKE